MYTFVKDRVLASNQRRRGKIQNYDLDREIPISLLKSVFSKTPSDSSLELLGVQIVQHFQKVEKLLQMVKNSRVLASLVRYRAVLKLLVHF